MTCEYGRDSHNPSVEATLPKWSSLYATQTRFQPAGRSFWKSVSSTLESIA